jgi:hypothetical protein
VGELQHHPERGRGGEGRGEERGGPSASRETDAWGSRGGQAMGFQERGVLKYGESQLGWEGVGFRPRRSGCMSASNNVRVLMASTDVGPRTATHTASAEGSRNAWKDDLIGMAISNAHKHPLGATSLSQKGREACCLGHTAPHPHTHAERKERRERGGLT